MWCENYHGSNMYVANVGSSTKLGQVCSKQGHMFIWYYLVTMKSYDHFKHLLDLVECTNVALCMVWWIKPQTQMEYDAFDFIRHL
jgi:hypothetical protein